MAAPRFWLASSSNRPRCSAVVRALVAARAGEARRQRAAQRRVVKLKLPPFDGEIVVFITVCFIIFAPSLTDSPQVSCHPFVKLECPLSTLNMRKERAESWRQKHSYLSIFLPVCFLRLA